MTVEDIIASVMKSIQLSGKPQKQEEDSSTKHSGLGYGDIRQLLCQYNGSGYINLWFQRINLIQKTYKVEDRILTLAVVVQGIEDITLRNQAKLKEFTSLNKLLTMLNELDHSNYSGIQSTKKSTQQGQSNKKNCKAEKSMRCYSCDKVGHERSKKKDQIKRDHQAFKGNFQTESSQAGSIAALLVEKSILDASNDYCVDVYFEANNDLVVAFVENKVCISKSKQNSNNFNSELLLIDRDVLDNQKDLLINDFLEFEIKQKTESLVQQYLISEKPFKPALDSYSGVNSPTNGSPKRTVLNNTMTTSFTIATWKLKSLLSVKKLDNVILEMEHMKLNILGIRDVQWPGSEKCPHKADIKESKTEEDEGNSRRILKEADVYQRTKERELIYDGCMDVLLDYIILFTAPENAMGTEKALFEHVRRGRKRSLLKLISEGKIIGRKGIGRRRISWLRNLREWFGLRMLSDKDPMLTTLEDVGRIMAASPLLTGYSDDHQSRDATHENLEAENWVFMSGPENGIVTCQRLCGGCGGGPMKNSTKSWPERVVRSCISEVVLEPPLLPYCGHLRHRAPLFSVDVDVVRV
ncbi:hypothetical protein ILUMI_19896 [Ignelater luminosus]|uniref:Uncharacterized protein n=1 Tax=Ignelater luminosus TaxID=2038154 RepID=A0A8K0CJ89_IGNLU|nr:hypothetical protein ILUMI_19896 [Ignelater luminosus]